MSPVTWTRPSAGRPAAQWMFATIDFKLAPPKGAGDRLSLKRLWQSCRNDAKHLLDALEFSRRSIGVNDFLSASLTSTDSTDDPLAQVAMAGNTLYVHLALFAGCWPSHR